MRGSRGVEYPIHPLDLTSPLELELTINGTNVNSTICTSALSSIGDSCGDGCDLIMGDVFLRNAITSYVQFFVCLLTFERVSYCVAFCL
jgi:hypothetical protein